MIVRKIKYKLAVISTAQDHRYNIIIQYMKKLLSDVVLANAILKSEEKSVFCANDFFAIRLLICDSGSFGTPLPTRTVKFDWYVLLKLVDVLESSRASTAVTN